MSTSVGFFFGWVLMAALIALAMLTALSIALYLPNAESGVTYMMRKSLLLACFILKARVESFELLHRMSSYLVNGVGR